MAGAEDTGRLEYRSEQDAVLLMKEMLSPAFAPPYRLEVSLNLFYEVVVDSRLHIRTDVRRPMRGQSAFQTDLCLVECFPSESGNEVLKVPRVVFEFKQRMTTHDILTYDAKARKHKAVYPYLRYGIVTMQETSVPRKFFVHNESLDFCLTLGSHAHDAAAAHRAFLALATEELAASHLLDSAVSGAAAPSMFRRAPVFGPR